MRIILSVYSNWEDEEDANVCVVINTTTTDNLEGVDTCGNTYRFHRTTADAEIWMDENGAEFVKN